MAIGMWYLRCALDVATRKWQHLVFVNLLLEGHRDVVIYTRDVVINTQGCGYLHMGCGYLHTGMWLFTLGMWLLHFVASRGASSEDLITIIGHP